MSEDCCQWFKNLCQPESMKFQRARSIICQSFLWTTFSLCSVKSKCVYVSVYELNIFNLCSMKMLYIKVTQFSQIVRIIGIICISISVSCLVILSSLLILLLFDPNNAVRNIRTIRTVNPTKYIIFLSCLTPHILLNITEVLRVQYCRF